MTTGNQPTTGSVAARELWAALSEGEQKTLAMGNGYHPFVTMNTLLDKGLMVNSGRLDKYAGWYELTALGREVLAAGTPTQTAVAEKPAAITAQQFVEQGYVNKIAANECVVKWGNNSVTDITFDDSRYTMWLDRGRNGAVWDTDKFTVTWLPPTDTPQAETARTGGQGDIDSAYEKLTYEMRDMHLALCLALDMEFDTYSSGLYASKIEALRMNLDQQRTTIAALQAELTRVTSERDAARKMSAAWKFAAKCRQDFVTYWEALEEQTAENLATVTSERNAFESRLRVVEGANVKLLKFVQRVESCDYSEHDDYVKARELEMWQEHAENLIGELEDLQATEALRPQHVSEAYEVGDRVITKQDSSLNNNWSKLPYKSAGEVLFISPMRQFTKVRFDDIGIHTVRSGILERQQPALAEAVYSGEAFLQDVNAMSNGSVEIRLWVDGFSSSFYPQDVTVTITRKQASEALSEGE
jgi:hypothetical protein